NAIEGSLLTASPSQTSDETETVTYQWQNSSDGISWSNISGATAATYQLAESDENLLVRVHTSLTDDTGQTVTADSNVTTAVKDVAPPLAVSISGNAIEGSTLTASPSQTSDETETVTYQWQNSSDGTPWNNISGATTPTNQLAQSDETPLAPLTT